MSLSHQAAGGQEGLCAVAALLGGVERSFGWLNRFRRLASDYQRLPATLAAWHFSVFSRAYARPLSSP
ncbi:transposase [Paraburkholderia sp. JPY419]